MITNDLDYLYNNLFFDTFCVEHLEIKFRNIIKVMNVFDYL